MGHFDNMLGSEETLFSNPDALNSEYVPKLLPHRENQQFQIASCIKPLFAQRNGRNAIIIGKPGIGKTVACKHVLSELEEQTDDIIPVYINCWKHNTTYKVLVEMCEILDYKFTQNKKTNELFKILVERLNKTSSVIVFDEIDKAEDNDFLYMIVEDVFKKSILLITNYKKWTLDLDERIKSRLMPEIIEFKPYTENEISKILTDRKRLAFYENVWADDAFSRVVKKTFEGEDIRIGLKLMDEAGKVAEDRSAKKISLEHYTEAEKKLMDYSIKKRDSLDEDEQYILDIVKKYSGTRIGELFKIYQKEGGKSAYKSFQRRAKKLVEDRFISAEKVTGGPEGSTTILSFEKSGVTKKLTDF